MKSLPKHDNYPIKCAACGNEEEHLNSLKYIYAEKSVGDNKMKGLCPSCYGGIIYYKKDWRNSKANSIPLTFKVYFKGDSI